MARQSVDYASMLKQAQNSYGAILQGYQQTLQGQQRNQQGINRGYNQLQRSVLGNVRASGAGRSQEIADYYTGQGGQQNQNLISRGLGNTTIASSVAQGNAYDQTKAQTALSGQVAGQMAQSQSQLGLAGLQYRNQAGQQNAQMQGQMMGYQGDYQRTLGGWAMQGLMQRDPQQYGGGGGGGGGGVNVRGGGGSVGSGGRDSIYAPRDLINRDSGREDPYINLNAGMGGGMMMGMGGGYTQPAPNPWQYAAPGEQANPVPGYTYDWSDYQ